MTILDRIVERKWQEIAEAKGRITETDLLRTAEAMPAARDFTAALQKAGPRIRIIAEVKKASPSAGIIRPDFDPVAIAKIYEANGAACLSVLTDRDFFQGDLSYLTAVHTATTIPALRKEFILDRYQLLEAKAAGADAILLIAEILPGNRMKELHDDAVALGLHVLIELHDAHELPRVVDTGTRLIGINNRDLRSFDTSLDRTLELLPKIPADRVVISESGIKTRADMLRLEAAGVKGVLVGESLMRSPDIGLALRELSGFS